MKTKEELNNLKEEVKTLNNKLSELTEEELMQVSGGRSRGDAPPETVTAPQQSIVITAAKTEVKEQFSGFTISIINQTNPKN